MKKLFLITSLSSMYAISQAQNTRTDSLRMPASWDSTFRKVEIESEFPGGQAEWRNFLGNNFTYPNKAVRKKIEGTVILQFIVCADGTVCDIQAISGPEILREAAIKALKNTPNWIPALQDGKQVKSYKKQPITFRLRP